MPIHSPNQRLAMLADVPAHIFYGLRSLREFVREHGALDLPVVVADKGYIDRQKTIFSINGDWGGMGRFVVNPDPLPLDIPPLRPLDDGDVLELGQDTEDFSYLADAGDGYLEWLEQWPGRRVRVHPKVTRAPLPELAEDIAKARLVVGLNTSALVRTSLAGVPVESYGRHCALNFMPGDREGCLRALRSFEFHRRERSTAEAITAALAASEPVFGWPPATPPTQKAGKAARKKKPKSRQSQRASGNLTGKSGAGSAGFDGT